MASQQLRIGRVSCVGNVYAVTAVCHQRRRYFLDHASVQIVGETIRTLDQQALTLSFAWVLMPDHLHWLFELRTGSLARCIQLLKGRSSLLINRQRGERATVWQPGYYDHALRSEESLRQQATYILANPLRAGLAQQLGDYPHSWCRWPLESTSRADL